MKSSLTERPAPANAAPPRTRRTELYLLSSDDELLLELGPLLGERYRVRTIDEPSELPVEEGRASLLILDSTRRPDALAVVAKIEQQHQGALHGGAARDRRRRAIDEPADSVGRAPLRRSPAWAK